MKCAFYFPRFIRVIIIIIIISLYATFVLIALWLDIATGYKNAKLLTQRENIVFAYS